MNMVKTTGISVLLLILLWLTSCRTGDQKPSCTGRINHVVLMKLKDPTQAPALMDDCRGRLETIPSVQGAFTGQHGDFGRTGVDDVYDVGFFVSFDTKEQYMEYLQHPDHIGLVEEWRPRFEWIRIHDIVDETVENTN